MLNLVLEQPEPNDKNKDIKIEKVHVNKYGYVIDGIFQLKKVTRSEYKKNQILLIKDFYELAKNRNKLQVRDKY